MSSSGDGTKSATPIWLAPQEPGMTVERPAMARRRVASGRLAGVRPAPVERLVRHVADRRERHEPPADDPVGDLEPAAHVDRPAGAVREGEFVARERLARGEHPAHRVAREAVARGIAPAVGEVGDDDVAGPTMTAQIDRQLVVGQDPAPPPGARSQGKRQAAEDRRPSGSLLRAGAYSGWKRPLTSESEAFHDPERSTGRASGVARRARPVVMAARPSAAISRRC